MTVGAGEAAEVTAVSNRNAGDEEAHRLLRRLRLLLGVGVSSEGKCAGGCGYHDRVAHRASAEEWKRKIKQLLEKERFLRSDAAQQIMEVVPTGMFGENGAKQQRSTCHRAGSSFLSDRIGYPERHLHRSETWSRYRSSA